MRAGSSGTCLLAAALLLLGSVSGGADESPALGVEISPEHPLFLFRDSGRDCADAGAYAQHVVAVWGTLPESLRPYSAIQVEPRGTDLSSRLQWYRDLLGGLQASNIPAVIRVTDGDIRRALPIPQIGEILHAFSCVKGIQAVGLPFEEYSEFGDPEFCTPAPVAWLAEAIELAAQNGRFISIELDKIRWPRAMANTVCEPLYSRLRARAAHVVGVAACRGPHTLPQGTALMGLWLEGGVGHWGVGPQSAWYSDALFVAPGVFGAATQPAIMPPPLYRAMIFMGALGGAPNTGRHYLVPIVSAFAPQDALSSFSTVIRPGTHSSAESWGRLLDSRCVPDGEGTALIVRIGRATFVMNTCENRTERQMFEVAALPAPVRGIEANRQASEVVLTWPFREGDLSYKVHRRVGSEQAFSLLTEALEERKFVDATADPNQNVYYSVTALTDDKEPHKGVVGYGDYLAFSNIESRIGEEVMLTPILGFAQSRPVETSPVAPAVDVPWWPTFEGLADADLPAANAIVQRLEKTSVS